MELIKESNRMYINDASKEVIAEITFPMVDDYICITHTFVSASLRGQGVADLLMQETLNSVKQQNKKVCATCSYAYKWLEKHEEYQEIWIR